jgi:hypothetical protein
LLSNEGPNIPLLLPPSIFSKDTWVLCSKKERRRRKRGKKKQEDKCPNIEEF